MIRPSNDLDVVWLCRNAVDFRKGINGLSVLVEDQLVRDPFNGQLFVFVNRRRDKIKILYWERAGFVTPKQSGSLQCIDEAVRFG
jgi:transposase